MILLSRRGLRWPANKHGGETQANREYHTGLEWANMKMYFVKDILAQGVSCLFAIAFYEDPGATKGFGVLLGIGGRRFKKFNLTYMSAFI